MDGLEGIDNRLSTAVLDLDTKIRAVAPGLEVVVTSGFRSPSHQERLRRLWDSGNRRGLTSRPAVASRHTQGRAVDLALVFRGVRVPVAATPRSYFAWMAAFMAPYGVIWGGNFKPPSPNHYEI